MAAMRNARWSQNALSKVAEALGEILFRGPPKASVRPMLLSGAAAALETIGHEITKRRGDGTSIELPHPPSQLGSVPRKPLISGGSRSAPAVSEMTGTKLGHATCTACHRVVRRTRRSLCDRCYVRDLRGLPYPDPPRLIWTEEVQGRLDVLFNAGLPASEIGRQLGVTKNAVIGRLSRMGMRRRSESSRRQIWTEELERDLAVLFDEGLPARHIGLRLGLTKNVVLTRLRRLGMRRKPDNSPYAGPDAMQRLDGLHQQMNRLLAAEAEQRASGRLTLKVESKGQESAL